ncbi:MAG: pyridoxamine 5'-phosphate oxidase family protein [Flavobacteriaceae bacterium]
MGDDRNEEHVWKLMDDISPCMLATQDGDLIRARPMAAMPDREAGAIYFLTDVKGHKDEDIARHPEVCLSFAEPGDNHYLSVTGRAEISADRDKIEQLWSAAADAWWDGPQDPSVRVLKVTPVDAQYWDAPGTIVSTIKMAAAAMSGTRPDMGEQQKVKM